MADRYWVGGTGTWSATNTSRWSATSGGGAGASVPQANDDVFFDANSNFGTGGFTVTMTNSPRRCRNITISGLDGVMTLAGSGGTSLIVSGSLFFPATNFTRTYTGTTTFNATTTGKTITTNGVSFGGNVTFDGTGGEWSLQDALTTTSTITLTRGTLNLNDKTLTGGIFSSSNTNTRSIAFGTSGSIVLTSGAVATVLSMANATNFTFTGTSNISTAMTRTRTFQFGPTGATSSNRLNINLTSGGVTPTFQGQFRQIDFTGSTTNFGAGIFCHGFTLASGGTYTGIGFTLIGDGTLTYTGKSTSSITINGTGITTTLASAGQNATTTLTNGTLDLAGFTLTSTTTFSTGVGTKNITFNGGTLVCSATSATAWNNGNPANFTTTAGTGTGAISMTSASAKTFVGGGSTYNCNLNQGGAGTLTITGANTFEDITNTNATASQITFPASTTNTFNNFTLSGTSGNLVSLRSSTPTTQFTLSKASGTVSVSFLDIQDSNATGGATWNAFTSNGCVDSGNNTGWIFVGAVVYDVTILESATAVEVNSLLGLFPTSVVETLTASDQVSSLADFAPQVSETSTASKQTFGAVNFGSTVNELATESEQTSSVIDFASQVNDSATSADQILSRADLAVQTNETTTGTDEILAGVNLLGQINESAIGSDEIVLAVDFASTINESVTGSDEILGAVDFGVQIDEASAGIDQIFVSADFASHSNEIVMGFDEVFLIGSFQHVIEESTTGIDEVLGLTTDSAIGTVEGITLSATVATVTAIGQSVKKGRKSNAKFLPFTARPVTISISAVAKSGSVEAITDLTLVDATGTISGRAKLYAVKAQTDFQKASAGVMIQPTDEEIIFLLMA